MKHDIVITEAHAGAGAAAFWRLSGALDVSKLAAEWKAAGLPEALLPETPPPPTALTRAVREQAKGRTLVRPLEGRNGYAVVQERAKGEDLSHAVNFRVRLDAIGRPVFSVPGGKWEPAATFVSGGGSRIAEEIAASYGRHLEECSPEDVGPWLVRLVTKYVDGLALRDGGGLYYVPPAHTATWNLITSCLSEVSAHRTFELPAMKSAKAVEAILDAVEQEAEREFNEMMAELSAETENDALGKRALQGRYDRVEEVEAKVARYEALLGAKTESLRERAENLRGALGAAMLKAASAGEES